MSPFEQARDVQMAAVGPENFWRDLALYHTFGYVFSTPEVFVMARPVCRDATEEQIRDPRFHFHPDDCDTWFFFLVAGDMSALWKLGPPPLEWCCFHHGKHDLGLHFVKTQSIAKFTKV